jgi:translation initiation factor IF-2
VERGQGNIQQQGRGPIRPAPQGQPRNQGGDNQGGQWRQQNQGQGVERGQGNIQQQGKGPIRPVPQGQPRNQGGDNQGGQWRRQNQGQGQAPY